MAEHSDSVVEQWNSDSGTVLWSTGRVMVEQGCWNSETVIVEQCCGTVMVEQCGGIIE